MIEAFCTWMAAGLDDLAVGSTLYARSRPADAPDACTVVLERTGAYVDPWLKREREVRFQLLTRGPTHKQAETEARRLFNWLVNRWGVALGGVTIHSIEGTGPQSLGTDQQGRAEYSANLTLRVREEV